MIKVFLAQIKKNLSQLGQRQMRSTPNVKNNALTMFSSSYAISNVKNVYTYTVQLCILHRTGKIDEHIAK